MDDTYKQNAFFGGVAMEDLERLDFPIEVCQFDDGELVFEEGAEGEHVYLVSSGEVAISKKGRGGQQELLAIKPPLSYFGEMALLLEDDQRRSARATACGPTELGRMNRAELHKLMAFSPGVAIHFTRMFASHLKKANTHFIDELIDAERLSLIGTMMSAMVHDFRNPIATISMASHYLKSKTENERMVKMGELTADAADQMLVMIQEVLDYSKGEIKLDLVPTGVNDLLESIDGQILGSLPGAGIEVQREIEFDGEFVADRNRVIRLLCNVIKNAAEAMKGGGALTLRVRNSGGRIRFEIEDNGCGIPEEVLARIFEPFVTHGKTDGTGLGMAIAKSVVEAHKGDIRIESEEGKGTTCCIDLPLDPSSVE